VIRFRPANAVLVVLLFVGYGIPGMIGCGAPNPEPPKTSRPSDTPASPDNGKPPRARENDGETVSRSKPSPHKRNGKNEPNRPPSGILPRFTRLSENAGVSFQRYDDIRGQHRILEANGGGAALFDYDADGRLDVFFTNGCRLPLSTKTDRHSNQLFRNRDGTRFTDATIPAGLRHSGYHHGCTVGDYDGDGFDDLYVTAFGPNLLYHNNGDGTFTEVALEADARIPQWSSSAAFADVNGDGHLDLYVVNYLQASDDPPKLCPSPNSPDGFYQCPPHMFPAADDVLLLSDGAGGWLNVTQRAGLTAKDGKGLGVVVFDANRDGRPDICVANDGVPNFLYMNTTGGAAVHRAGLDEAAPRSQNPALSQQAGQPVVPRFEEQAALMGVALNFHGDAEAGMGIACGDYDADGDSDVLMTHFEGETNTLWQNRQGEQFVDRTRQSRLGPPSLPFTGFGTEFLDVDNDGWLDLFVANGHVDDRRWQQIPWSQKPQMFRNERNGTFLDISHWSGAYFRKQWLGRGAAVGDIDNDGDVDLVVSHQRTPSAVLSNSTETNHRSVNIKLVGGPRSNRSGVGARLEAVGLDLKLVREVIGGGSFQSSSDRRVHVGLGSHAFIPRLRIRWPSAETDEWSNVRPGHYVAVEGRGLLRVPACGG